MLVVWAAAAQGAALCGCHVQLRPQDCAWVHEQEATGTVDYRAGDFKPRVETFHKVPIDRLEKLGRALSYLGSEGEYHLMRVWEKFSADPHEITRFAVRRADCDVASAQQRAKEFEEHGASYRHVVWVDARCTVPLRP